MSSTCSSGLVPLGLCVLLLFHLCVAQVPCMRQQSPRLTGRSDCQIEKITAREPNRRQVSEAGVSEFWDSFENDELECAGVEMVRHTINPKGLLLPYYPNTPELVYVVRGQGLQGTVLAGCEETFETSFPLEGGRGQFFDKHQKVYRYKEGDVLALPAGAVHWTYNDGETPIVVVALRDTSNVANQLDRNFKKFFLAGNPQSQMQQGEPWGRPGQSSRPGWGTSRPGHQQPSWGTGRPGETGRPFWDTGSPGQSPRPSWGTSRPGETERPFWDTGRPGQSQPSWGTSRPGQIERPFWDTGRPSQPDQPSWGTTRPGQPKRPSWETSRPDQPKQPSWGTSRPGQPKQPSWGTSRPGQPGRPSWDTGRPGQPEQPSWGTSRPGQPERPSWDIGRPGQPEQPSWGTSHPGQPKSPSWETSRPGQPGRPSWDTGRPGQPERPSWETSRPGQPEQPSWETTRPGQPKQPSWGTGRPGQPEQPSWETSRPGQPKQPSWGTGRPDQPERPSWDTGRPGQPKRPSWEPEEPEWGQVHHGEQQPGGPSRPMEPKKPGKHQPPKEQPGKHQPPKGQPGQGQVHGDPCEVCRQIRREQGLDTPCANCNEVRSQQEQEGYNMFAGFDEEILQQVYNIDYNIVMQLKGLYDDRGLIVLAENFNVLIPEEQEQFSPRANGIEQTICSTQFSANIANPAVADVYNPRGGRISTLNSDKLPVLESLQLSAERGVLYKNAVLAPHYNLNAHSIIYITSGNSRLQIVRSDGSQVFDDWVQEGQLIVVPQDFAVIKKAGEQGCEWVAFKTNDNAMTTQLAGRFSYIRALPEEVLMNSYNINREEAKMLKYNRKEGVVLSPRSGPISPVKKAENVVLKALFG